MEQMMSANLAFTTRDKIPNIYEHWIAKDFLTYIRIAQGSTKRADFLSVMNKPNRYIGRNSLCEPEVAFDEWMKMYDEQPWIAERIEKEGKPAVEDYFRFLSSGGSDSPVALLKLAGVDLTKKNAFVSCMDSFRAALDEFESL